MTDIWDGTFREPRYWSHFGNRLAELTSINTGSRILDVGTGWGDVLFPAAKKVGQQGWVTGIDNWEPCVKKTLSLIEERGVTNADAVRMDANNLAFKDSSFDVVMCGFIGWDVVFDFDRYEFIGHDHMMKEIYRVLKKGGKVGKSAWAVQGDSEWMAELINKHLGPGKAQVEPIEPVYSAENKKGQEIILGDAGFKEIDVMVETEEFTFQNEAEWIEVMNNSGWRPYLEQIKGLPPERLNEFEQDVFTHLRDHKSAAGIHYTRTVLFAFGIK